MSHAQSAMERQKASLARELHDDMGGLLVVAVMDVAWAEQHSAAAPVEVREKLVRARQSLAAAIDLKRRLIEDLRPTLLDNVGLFAALRWYVQSTCDRAGVACRVQLPEDERHFLPNVPIAIFRIVQEALGIIVARPSTAPLEFRMDIHRRILTIQLARDEGAASESEADSMETIVHRIAALGGEFTCTELTGGGIGMVVSMPLDGISVVA